ncbi:transglycosylase domain-containing protein [Intestinibacter bartlettii]|uniref:Penicillin-binding protein 1A n=1 Tax=Intestinibacter bartlettii TaxID=261299 RepID=A0ABS8CY97_9FIRM|nr:biosynthetic peptidoglycan transglycosylase [Intestinibacter bartlettii]MCB5397627.1 transglycosylase domain-containing protein [Intestinibacter bartlettii]MCB5404176.1 transglycosylase domain-containing protein [Intestinibacter bartlettii]MCB5446439.1 transglycosylase domain-containing protein [Intestinibacter bartlettii]MCB5720221.1 transglycosylase domain-containing protein [Intestinibacter bartlettii]MCB5749167.1 transglycosylase domain-containing protein [Intestinibacter bartlettii]
MAENNENKIRRRKVSSTNLKNTNNNRNTIKNSNNTKNKSKNSRNNKKESSVQDIKRKQEEKEQFELEREIYYRKKKIKRKRRLKLITRLASLCLILLVIGGICFSAFAISAIQGAPKVTKELIRENYISSEVVSGDKIPDDLKHAVVAMEDRRFYKHNGVDFKSIVRAALNNLVTSSTQGGSTIDMQVSKNLLTSEDKTYKRKVRDMYNAIQMNKIMTKDEILTTYLNNIYLGRSAYGVAKGAKVYFNKDVSDLNLAQCAMLAGITNNPFVFREHDQAKARQILVLNDMLEQGYITQDEYQEAVDDPTLFASEID